MSLTSEQTEIIKSTVPILKQHGGHITDVFYGSLLKENPELNNIFNQANQRNGHQAQALASALFAYAANIDNLEVLKPAIERINQKHVSLYITPEQYDIVGKYLLAAMKTVLGTALTSDILGAWEAAYKQLASLMIKREDELYSEFAGWTSWRDFKITQKVKESEEVTSFYLQPVDDKALPPFLPGQYISVQTEVEDLKYLQARQYSLSDAPPPAKTYYRISVKRESGLDVMHPDAQAHPGYISNILHKTKHEGDILQVSHPHGDFFLDLDTLEEGSALVLISAGVGLTPMLSILNTLIAQKSTIPVSWCHAVRGTSAQGFAPYIRSVCSEHSNVHSNIFVKNPSEKDVQGTNYHHTGRMALEKLDEEKDLFLKNKRTRYFICGPPSFMTDMQKKLQNYGVDAERVKLELFGTGEIPSS